MTLEINGKTLDFKLGIGFLGELIEETGKGIEDVLLGINNNPYKYIPTAMYVSAKYALERKGKDVTFDKFEFLDWIESDGGLSDKNISAVKFLQALTKDLTKDLPKDEETPVEEKKSA